MKHHSKKKNALNKRSEKKKFYDHLLSVQQAREINAGATDPFRDLFRTLKNPSDADEVIG
jgi:hypothetical protein